MLPMGSSTGGVCDSTTGISTPLSVALGGVQLTLAVDWPTPNTWVMLAGQLLKLGGMVSEKKHR